MKYNCLHTDTFVTFPKNKGEGEGTRAACGVAGGKTLSAAGGSSAKVLRACGKVNIAEANDAQKAKRRSQMQDPNGDSTKNNAGNTLTRRGFFAAAAGCVAAIATAGALTGCTSAANDTTADTSGASATTKQDSDLDVLSVGTDAVFTTEDCTYLDDSTEAMYLAAQTSMPFGTTVTASDSQVACALIPGDTGDPLLQVALINLSNATFTTILSKAQNPSSAYQIFDARANSQGIVWLECNILEDAWCVYTAKIADGALGDVQLVGTGDAAWDTPSLAISGSYAFWQMMPKTGGASASADSVLMRVPLGGGEADAHGVCFSQGRFACAPAPTAKGVVAAPRMKVTSTQYKLVHIDAATEEILDVLALPASMKPYCAGYGTSGFSFAFDGIYESGGGIANLGTYTPAAIPKDGNYNAEGTTWFRFPRTPICGPAWCGDWFLVKSTSVVAGVDTSGKRYFTIDAQGTGESYGEYLASAGATDKIVTFANLNYTPLSGDAVKECNVRVWAPNA